MWLCMWGCEWKWVCKCEGCVSVRGGGVFVFDRSVVAIARFDKVKGLGLILILVFIKSGVFDRK